MAEQKSKGLSRRSALKTLASLACSIPLFLSVEVRRPFAQAKVSKAEAQYQDEPKGNQMCENCAHFLPPASCAVVEGEISPRGWSRYWAPKQ